jgi:hypothetical protein
VDEKEIWMWMWDEKENEKSGGAKIGCLEYRNV